MERRRRRPQPVQDLELQQRDDIQPAVHQEEPAHLQTDDLSGQQSERRRRRAQIPVDAERTAGEYAGDEGSRNAAASPGQQDKPELNAVHIPQLPKAEVQVEETKRGAQKLIKKPAVKVKDALPDTDKRQYTGRIRTQKQHGAKRTSADVVQKAASAAKTAAGWIGGAILLIVMAAGEGVVKLGTWLSGMKSGRKSRVNEDGHAPQPQEFVLEAIRPEDYHGKAQSRSDHAQHGTIRNARAHGGEHEKVSGGKKAFAGRKMPDTQQLISLVLAGVAIFSFCMIVSILWRTVRTTYLNKQLTQLYNEASSGEEIPAETTVYAPEATPEMVVFMPQATEDPQQQVQDGAAIEQADEDETPEETAQPEPTSVPAETPLPMGKRTYHQVGGDALPQMEALHKENRDIVGWLKIENVLDQPVVYKDNSYYLTRDFYKKKNTSGTIFLDVNHPFKEKTQNLLLHGHNMKDGTMFGRLLQYETDLNYVRWHPFVRFDTLWRQEEYVIFAVLRVSLDVRSKDFFNYFSHATFSSDAEFESYIRQLQLRSIYAIPVDVKPTDALLTMSTCLDDDRLVIVARRMRKGETHTQIREWTNLTTRQ